MTTTAPTTHPDLKRFDVETLLIDLESALNVVQQLTDDYDRADAGDHKRAVCWALADMVRPIDDLRKWFYSRPDKSGCKALNQTDKPAVVPHEHGEVEIAEDVSQEMQQKAAAFDALFSEWLDAMAAVNRPSEPMDDEALDARSDRAAAAARLVCATPAVLPYQVRYKIAVLEDALKDGTEWADNRELAMLGGIKADLAGFCS